MRLLLECIPRGESLCPGKSQRAAADNCAQYQTHSIRNKGREVMSVRQLPGEAWPCGACLTLWEDMGPAERWGGRGASVPGGGAVAPMNGVLFF